MSGCQPITMMDQDYQQGKKEKKETPEELIKKINENNKKKAQLASEQTSVMNNHSIQNKNLLPAINQVERNIQDLSFKLYLATSETISYKKYDMFNEKGKLRTADLAKILKEDGERT